GHSTSPEGAPTTRARPAPAELRKTRPLMGAGVKKLGLARGREDAASAPPAAGATQNASLISPPGAAPAPSVADQSRADAVIDTILNGLNIQVVPNSNLIYVRYRSSDPVKGAVIVNTLLDLYRDMYVNIKRTVGV